MKKKALSLLLASAMAVSMAGCGNKGTTPPGSVEIQSSESQSQSQQESSSASSEAPQEDAVYVRGDDEERYNAVLGGFKEYTEKAKAAATIDERFMLFAQAEAYLLDSATMIPTTTQGGAYTISRIAPRTIPYVQWGNDDDRLKGLVISDEFCTPDERKEMLSEWSKAVAGEGAYDPAKYLTGKGHKLQKSYTTTFSTAPVTLDWLNTSSQSDTEITVNCVEGLVEYNNLGQMMPALAESWEVSEDGLKYTFKIRPGVAWYTSEGTKYADVTADDFAAGFRHMLDAKAGLEWLVDGIVAGATKYYEGGGSWDEVGYKALDASTLEITLEKPVSYFMTMLTYSCFLPMCKSFYEAHGGVFGVNEYATKSADTNAYTFGKADDVASQVYCGPFLVRTLQKDSVIELVANKNYYNTKAVALESIKWVFDDGSNPEAIYNDTLAGVYPGVTLGQASGLLDKAKADGNYEKYAYVSDTTSTTYFGGLNVNRGTFALESGTVKSPKTEQQKIDTSTAMLNQDFRKALLYAFDKKTWNAVQRGEDLALTNVRNMYTHPQFVQLENDTTDADGHTFPAGTFYGDMVQYYCDKMGIGIKVADGENGWFLPDKAKEHLAAAKTALGDSVAWPIQIDIVYLSTSDTNTAQAAAYKKIIEGTLGAENVQVNLLEATTTEDFYASGYRAANGEAGNFDMFYGSGWGPDYGDPSTYLDTFQGEGAGYMTKVIGLF